MRNTKTQSEIVPDESRFQPRTETLSYIFQEVLTAVMRLRTNRQSVSDARVFRLQIREALKVADREAIARQYSPETVRLAVFAVVAFVDESVLNQPTETFSDWARAPLQQELFEVHVAGEIFFDNVRRLLSQADSRELVDLLELHQLCLLLGYRGRYGAGAQAELQTIIQDMGDKIRRVRGPAGELSPAWKLPAGETLSSQSDPWARRLLVVFACCALFVVLLFFGFRLSLGSGVSTLETLASEARR